MMKLATEQRGHAGEQGAIAPITALLMVALFGFGALVVDVGMFQLKRRQLQQATDAAALAATYTVSGTETTSTTASGWVSDYLTRNGFGDASFAPPVIGTYCPESSLAPAARFTAGATSCPGYADLGTGPNAVMLSTSLPVPLFLGRVLLPGTSDVTVTASATAAQIPQAGFYAGTGLLAINGGLINAVLGGLLGANVSLTTVQYQGLLNTNISALSFFNALATNIGVSGGTYSSLLQSTVTVQQVLTAEADALNAPGSVAYAALNSLATSVPGSQTVSVGSLFDLGVWQDLGIGSSNPPPALSATLNAYQLATLSVQVANGQHAVTIPPANLGIPGVATVSVASTIIEPPVSAPFVFGPIGMTVHTAQVRLQLTLQLLSVLSLGGLLGSAPVSLPIYVEIAPGEAKLQAIACGYNPGTDATVTIAAASGAAAAYVGSVSPTAMTNYTTEPTVAPATLVNVLGLVTVSGSASVFVGSSPPTQPPNLSPTLTELPPFTQTDITNATSQSIESTNMLSDLLQSLGNNLKLTGSLLGISLPSTSPILSNLANLLQPAFAGLDTLVDELLSSLGIRIGYVDVTVTGVRCGRPVLVN
jgi:uncharacterized membrane protein